MVQQKTGSKLTIPLHRDLLEVLAVANRDHVTIINTQYGKPFTVDGFGQWIRDAITVAGLPLETSRTAFARQLVGAWQRRDVPPMIMAVLGHKTLSETERYTRLWRRIRAGLRP